MVEKKKVRYFAIKIGDKFLTRIGTSLTEDLGQARLYRGLDAWNKTSASILKSLKKEYGDNVFEDYRVVMLELKEV